MKGKTKVKITNKECGCEKTCVRCGDKCWISKVDYCWECYKYEKYESR